LKRCSPERLAVAEATPRFEPAIENEPAAGRT